MYIARRKKADFRQRATTNKSYLMWHGTRNKGSRGAATRVEQGHELLCRRHESAASRVVHTEARIFSCAKTPFSEPLGKYVDRYAPDAVDYFLTNVTSLPEEI